MNNFNTENTAYVFTACTYSFLKFFCALILYPMELSVTLKNKNY